MAKKGKKKKLPPSLKLRRASKTKKGKVRKDFLLKDLKKKFKEEKELEKDEEIFDSTIELKESNRFENTLRLAIVLVFIGIIGLGGFFFYATFHTREESDTITLQNVKPPETGGSEEDIEYYSQNLNLILHYASDKFDVSDSEENVYISPKEVFDTYALLEVLTQESAEDAGEYYTNKYKELHPGTEVTREEEGDDGLFYIELSYSQDFSFKKENTQKVFHTIIVDKTNLISLDIIEKGSNTNTQRFLDDLIKILNSTGLDPVNITQEVEIELSGGDLLLSFARDKWTIKDQSENALELSFRHSEFEVEEEFINSKFSFAIYVQSPENQDVDEQYLLDLLQNDLTSAQENFQDFQFEAVTEESQTEIDGTTFYFIQYKYIWLEKVDITTKYFGYDETNGLLVEITTHMEDPQTEGAKELGTLLSSIDFKDEEGEEEAFVPMPNILGETSAEIDKAVFIGKPSVVNIFNKSCVKLEIKADTDLAFSSGKAYSLCSLGFGSGFFVNKDGYIISNAHVIAPNPIDIAIQGMLYGEDRDNLYKHLGYDAILWLEQIYPEYDVSNNLDDPEIVDLVETAMVTMIVVGEEEEIFQLDDVTYENYVQKEIPFKLDKYTYDLEDVENYIKTEFVTRREIDSLYTIEVHEMQEEEDGITNPDLALAKTSDQDDAEYPTIPLADFSTLSVGLPINVIGFPAVAEDKDIFSPSASLVPTVTRGTISAIKPNFDNTFDLLQIDASISHGNSGGPIINSEGKLVGVATYILNLGESGDFNAGVSVKEVTRLLEEEDISNDVGRLTALVEEGIENYSLSYYKWAIDNLEEAKSLNSSTADILDPVITNAQTQIDQGNDNTPLVTIGDIYIHQNELIIIGVVAGLLLFGVSLLVLLFMIKLLFGRRKRRQKAGRVAAAGASPPLTQSTKAAVQAPQQSVSKLQRSYVRTNDQGSGQQQGPVPQPSVEHVAQTKLATSQMPSGGSDDVSGVGMGTKSKMYSAKSLDPSVDYISQLQSGESKSQKKDVPTSQQEGIEKQVQETSLQAQPLAQQPGVGQTEPERTKEDDKIQEPVPPSTTTQSPGTVSDKKLSAPHVAPSALGEDKRQEASSLQPAEGPIPASDLAEERASSEGDRFTQGSAFLKDKKKDKKNDEKSTSSSDEGIYTPPSLKKHP